MEEQLLAFLDFKVQKTEQALNGINLSLLLSTDRCNLESVEIDISLKLSLQNPQTYLNSTILFVDLEGHHVVLLQQIPFVLQAGDAEFMRGHSFAGFVAHLHQSAVLRLVRIDAPQRTQNHTIVDCRQYLRLRDATLRDNFDVLGRDAVAGVDGTARGQRIFYLVAELKGVGVADEVAEVEEHFLIVLERFDEAEVFLMEVLRLLPPVYKTY